MPSLPPAITLKAHEIGKGPLVVALHDLGRDGKAMLRALKPLGKRYRVVAPDLRGHGASPVPSGPWSIDDFASDVSRLIAAESGDAIVVALASGCQVRAGGRGSRPHRREARRAHRRRRLDRPRGGQSTHRRGLTL